MRIIMKKYLILAVAALAASAACTKVENVPTPDQAISFSVARYVPQTKAPGENMEYSTSDSFGTYSWFIATDDAGNPISAAANTYSDHAPFMVNDEVWYDGTVWTTKAKTYYWPKTGTMDFISYSPYAATANPVVTKDANHDYTLDYSSIEAPIAAIDYMYSDKVNCVNKLENQQNDLLVTGTDPGYRGVPTLFRHALAKVNFAVQPTFVEYTDPIDANLKTKWEITVNSLKISGFYTQGTCHLSWSNASGEWVKPTNEVWTVATGSAQTAAQELVASPITLVEDDIQTPVALTALTQSYVMPQDLVSGVQKLELDIDIVTKLFDDGTGAERTITENYHKTLNLLTISSCERIQMNKNLTYVIRIKPTATATTGGHVEDPEDVIITFDPAVRDWDTQTETLTITI